VDRAVVFSYQLSAIGFQREFMSETILLIAHVDDGTLARPGLEALGAALDLRASLGATLVVGLVGPEAATAAPVIGACDAARYLVVEGPAFAQARYATDAAAAESLARAAEATLVVAAGTPRWLRVLPGVAHRLGGRADTHLTSIGVADGKVAATRWYYRQRIEAVQTRTERPWILVVDPGCHAPWNGQAREVAVETITVDVAAEHTRTRVTGIQAPGADADTIRPDADMLFVAGAGWTKKQADGQPHAAEAEALILGFLARSKASLGGSKSLVDLSGEGQTVLRFMTHMNQVGQTGSTPRHPKGLATCCHGEEPHVVGWRFITERRAINLDPNCGWARGKADVLYVADAFQVMAKVNALLGAGRQ
jgi:electron transfer flavoprotein alpha subunit